MKDQVQHYEVTASISEDDGGQMVTLRQEDYSGNGDNYVVSIHQWQLRHICEELGIMPADREAARTISTLQRRLLVLADRISHISEHLITVTDANHAGLGYEQDYCYATDQMAKEFCFEFRKPTEAVK